MRIGRWMVFVATAAMVTLATLQGCSGGTEGGSNVCAAAPACLKGVIPSTSAQQQCSLQISDLNCGAAYKAMKECQTYRAQCTSSGAVSTSATNTECRTEITAYSACTSPVADASTDSCRRRTCSQQNANCGEVDDGCGTKLQCGTCTNGQTCGGGAPNRCGCSCDPTWCGTVSACGTTVTCPNNCAAPQFCGGAGIANRCGCAPSGAISLLTAASVSTAPVTLEAGSQTSWGSATNARLSDDKFATASMAVGSTTQFLVALSYGVGLPAGATVDGIVVQVERSASAGLATSDYAVHLIKNTQIQSAADNKAAVGVMWPMAEATATYGGPTDTWGTTWTAAEINAGGFGVALSATYTGGLGNEQARVDSIRVTVHYSGVACQ